MIVVAGFGTSLSFRDINRARNPADCTSSSSVVVVSSSSDAGTTDVNGLEDDADECDRADRVVLAKELEETIAPDRRLDQEADGDADHLSPEMFPDIVRSFSEARRTTSPSSHSDQIEQDRCQ